MISSGNAKYDGIQKMNAVVSYDMDGKSGKIKIDPSGKISKHSEKSEGEDEEENKTSMTDDDLGVVRKLMSNQDKKVVDTAVKGTVNVNSLGVTQVVSQVVKSVTELKHQTPIVDGSTLATVVTDQDGPASYPDKPRILVTNNWLDCCK
jgi:hypothetical protein